MRLTMSIMSMMNSNLLSCRSRKLYGELSGHYIRRPYLMHDIVRHYQHLDVDLIRREGLHLDIGTCLLLRSRMKKKKVSDWCVVIYS